MIQARALRFVFAYYVVAPYHSYYYHVNGKDEKKLAIFRRKTTISHPSGETGSYVASSRRTVTCFRFAHLPPPPPVNYDGPGCAFLGPSRQTRWGGRRAS